MSVLCVTKPIDMTTAEQINETLKSNGINKIFVGQGAKAIKWYSRYGFAENSGYSISRREALQAIESQSVETYIEVATIINHDPFYRC